MHEAYVRRLLAPYVGDGTDVDARLYATERRNLELFGYGIKGFTLSMIETAIEVSDGEVTAAEIGEILALGKRMLAHPVELIEGVERDRADARPAGYRLVLVTKGDLFHQEQKVAASGLADHFERVEIVSEKDEATYAPGARHAWASPPRTSSWSATRCAPTCCPCSRSAAGPSRCPHRVTWSHEVVDHSAEFPVLERLADLPAWLETVSLSGQVPWLLRVSNSLARFSILSRLPLASDALVRLMKFAFTPP